MDKLQHNQDRLFCAIEEDETKEVKKILSKHPTLSNFKRITGFDFEQEVSTPLIRACKEGRSIYIK